MPINASKHELNKKRFSQNEEQSEHENAELHGSQQSGKPSEAVEYILTTQDGNRHTTFMIQQLRIIFDAYSLLTVIEKIKIRTILILRFPKIAHS